MKVLLLGATGRVGSRLLPALVKHQHSVVVLVRSPNKLPPHASSHIAATITGSATDVATIKSAILDHNCDAVVNAAGLASMTSFGKQGDLTKIITAVAEAAAAAAKERGGPPLRCWFMSGWAMLDSPKPPAVIMDYAPLFPEHRKTFDVIKQYDAREQLTWSIFCASTLTPRFESASFPPAESCSVDNLVAKADSPPAWSSSWSGVPLIGTYLNIFTQAGNYKTPLEDSADFIAADLEKGLGSDFVGKRVGLKLKEKGI
ncbi:hypothetical protein G7Z17_g6492 [Cylindrodendrum hubeiense]|uniref:NAD(P)-binding domain-containing protein n=1 Tax=Cylindrodendrum hubeiense TaxID=595255 RepID=A0A9P5LGA0_9HYPO|nr:hypothetical protein G7Z17_g6492 [Cylindrodendrum hubeiense]